jgi:two-component system sensor histidine kinase VicK
MATNNDKKQLSKTVKLKGENQDLKEDKKVDKVAIEKLEEEIDIRKEYEESQQRFETIFYQSKQGNKIISSDLRILQVNKVLPKMLGYTQKEMLGSQATEYAHPDFVHHWHDLRESLWTKKIPSFQIDTCLVRKDGSIVWCQVSSIVFKDKGADMGYTMVEDISQRKTLELKLQKLYEYQETMLYMVAHDLKSPLHNIHSLSGLLKDNLEKPTSLDRVEKSISFATMICETCEKAQAIIRDLLFVGDFKAKANLKNTNLTRFIEAELPVLRQAAEKKGIQVKFRSPAKPVDAQINGDKFSRLLENLLSNAVKFTNPGGQVTIALKNRRQKILLQVSDTGIGIPEKLQASIFDKFTKANRKGTKGESTTGLGLYIVKQIVDIHQGKIWIESQEGKGTCFFIELT